MEFFDYVVHRTKLANQNQGKAIKKATPKNSELARAAKKLSATNKVELSHTIEYNPLSSNIETEPNIRKKLLKQMAEMEKWKAIISAVARRENTINEYQKNPDKINYLNKRNPCEFSPVWMSKNHPNQPQDEYALIKKAKDRADRKAQRQAKMEFELKIGLINHFGEKRASLRARTEQKSKNKKTQNWLKSHAAVGKNGEVINLTDRQKLKSAEFAIICNGIQTEAEKNGMKWAQIVVTLPPELHINPSNGNDSWDGTMPNEALKKIRKGFTKVTNNLQKQGIKITGVTTTETHSDGTPHANFLIYMPKGSEKTIEQLFKKTMKFGNNSKAAINFVVKDQYHHNGKCGFAKYASKGFESYIAKNLDGEQDQQSLAEQTIASTFGWRRWAFFGIPSITKWRRLRSQSQNPQSTPLLNSMWRAARSNEFDKFIALDGGIGARKKKQKTEIVSKTTITGKSHIAVGVREKSTGIELITKKIGYFELIKIVTSNTKTPTAINQNQSLNSGNSLLKLTDPRVSQNQAKIIQTAKIYAEMSGKSPPTLH